MNLLNKLTIKNLLLNKKRTIVTIIGIILSIALISAVFSMFFSFQESMIVYEKELKGDFHARYTDVSKEDLNIFENNTKIKDFYYSYNVGFAKIESENAYKPYAYINAINKDDYNKFGFTLVSGRMPNNSREIVIPKHLDDNGKLKLNIGDTITLNVGERVVHYEDEDIIENKYSKVHDGEVAEITNTKEMTFTIVGVIERPNTNFEPYTSSAYSFITCLDDNIVASSMDVYVKLNRKNLKDIYKVSAGILGIDKELYDKLMNDLGSISTSDYDKIMKEIDNAKYDVSYNSYLMTLETGNSQDDTLNALKGAVIIVVIIIIVTSVFCIKNSFDISITEKIKQYGMLSSIGATHLQIKKNVYFEAIILAIIGIPLGILSGICASYILIIISNYLLKSSLNITLVFKFSFLVIIFSILLGLITILFASRKSAKKASKVSPISAIRNNDDIKIKAKKLKTPKWVKKLFGIGGEISYKNLKRSKKKYRTTVISIVVCVSIFISLSYFTSLGYKVISYELNVTPYDFEIYYDQRHEDVSKIDKEITNIVKEDIVKDYSITLGADSFTNPEKNKYTKEYLKLRPSVLDEDYEDYNHLVVLDDTTFRNYTKTLKLNYDDVKDKAIMINTVWEYNEDNKEYKIEKYNYKAGDILTLEYKMGDLTKDINLEIAEITNKKPYGNDERNYATEIFVNENYLEYIRNVNYKFIYLKTSKPDQLQKNMETILKDYNYNYNNVSEDAKQMKSIILLVSIFLYGFITVIALIGITNIFNTVNTNMMLRRREFAMLKSIGMTKNEFNRMIRLESVFYGSKALIIGVPIGLVLSYLIHKAVMNGEYVFAFEIPYLSLLITCLVVFILLLTIMKYSLGKINKQNIIETIRNENI